MAHYSAYDKEFSKKPTTFYSNIALQLKKATEKAEVTIIKKDDRKAIYGYNQRSNIPLLLIKDILEACIKEMQLKEVG